MSSDSKEYELLTKRVFQAMLSQQSAQNVTVQHNVQLVGRDGVSRQTDVYWEFEIGDMRHHVIVECKAWSNPVPVGVVDAMIGKLDAFPGYRGAIVAPAGFQEGAKTKAEAANIILWELRPPTEDDWAGDYLMGVSITMNIFQPKGHKTTFVPDVEWNKAELKRLGREAASFNFTLTGRTLLLGEAGNEVIKLDDVLNHKLNIAQGEPPAWYEFTFAEPVYLPTGDPSFPRIRALGVKMLAEIPLVLSEEINIRLDRLVSHILKKAGEADFKMLTPEGRELGEDERKPPRLVMKKDNEE